MIRKAPIAEVGFVCGVCGFLALAGVAAQVDLVLPAAGFPSVDRPVIAVNRGDTVRWRLAAQETSSVRSYDGSWTSLVLSNVGDTFSHTFTNSGFVAYHTRGGDATITVLPVLSNPPAVTINDPVEGLILPTGQPVRPLATLAAGESNVLSVSFFSGTNLEQVVTNPPYTAVLQQTNFGPALNLQLTLSAKLLRADGSSAVSAPVHVRVVGGGFVPAVYSPRRLPQGGFLIYFLTSASMSPPSYVVYKDRLSDPRWRFLALGSSDLGYGVYVDSAAATLPQRFYQLEISELAPLP